MKTLIVKPAEVKRDWYVVDAEGMTVGRLASRVAEVLLGKLKPNFSYHVDVGDFVVVLNADKVQFTGNKWRDKLYYRHSGYPGGLKVATAETVAKKHPDRIVRIAVNGMLPKNRLRSKRISRLKIYTGAEHPHAAQQPRPFPKID
ncbi:MAG: 50S ribosomal protein L13 [Armatimonadetes bacterium]|nr:50S ribosomal protein L13 [Armatimonadota bacterium]